MSDSTNHQAIKILPLRAYAQFYFFEEERSERYVEYQLQAPHLSAEQIVLQVNLDLDTPPYQVYSVVSNSSSLLALVNKHSCLPYDYRPADLDTVGEVLLRYEAALWLEQLVADAAADGVTLNPISGYRDASYQDSLYSGYVDSVGVEWADAQSAQGGFSEHQTGLAVDFSPTTAEFYNSPAAYWLEDNAYRYGFIIRYPDAGSDLTLYIYEPWHIRYVGTKVSSYMHDHNIVTFEEYYIKYILNSRS